MTISDKGKELVEEFESRTVHLSDYKHAPWDGPNPIKQFLSVKVDLLQYIADLEAKARAWDDLPELIFLPEGGKD